MQQLMQYDEQMRQRHGVCLVGGVDEAGRGPLAGPVVAACVVLGPEARLPGVNDSKKLTRARREALAPEILNVARAAGVGLATAAEIDRINILQATHLAAARAMAGLAVSPEFLITDYLKLRGAPCPVLAITKGDATSLAVAAASILAKVARDRIMAALDAEYPQYGFAGHKGYPTRDHYAALERHGPSTVHRRSFKGVAKEGAGAEVFSISAEAGRLPDEIPQIDPIKFLEPAISPELALGLLPECEFPVAAR